VDNHLRTLKIHHFSNLVKWLNLNRANFAEFINASPLFNNAWLSDFWDADSSFEILF